MFAKIAGSVRWESKLTGKSAMITLRHAGVATGRNLSEQGLLGWPCYDASDREGPGA